MLQKQLFDNHLYFIPNFLIFNILWFSFEETIVSSSNPVISRIFKKVDMLTRSFFHLATCTNLLRFNKNMIFYTDLKGQLENLFIFSNFYLIVLITQNRFQR